MKHIVKKKRGERPVAPRSGARDAKALLKEMCRKENGKLVHFPTAKDFK